MRYSFSATGSPSAIANAVRAAGKATEGADAGQVSAATAAVRALAKDLGAYGTVVVLIEGHANPEHSPMRGEQNDWLRIRVNTEPPTPPEEG